MLEIGSAAPDVELEDTDGRAVHLPGDRAVLVYFTRSTSCPVCNRHVRDLARRRDAFAASDVRILVAVPADREEAAAWKDARGVPFPVVVGRQGTPHASIGLTRKVFGSMQQSGWVLIDSGGIVRHARAATMPTGGYDAKAVTAAVESLRARP
ncbi:redoxin domain-containing protein [Spirillospora sp. NPDC052242]